jgi:hypothetical protein
MRNDVVALYDWPLVAYVTKRGEPAAHMGESQLNLAPRSPLTYIYSSQLGQMDQATMCCNTSLQTQGGSETLSLSK